MRGGIIRNRSRFIRSKDGRAGPSQSQIYVIYQIGRDTRERTRQNSRENGDHARCNPEISDGESLRIERGGSWANLRVDVRYASRFMGSADFKYRSLDFRLARNRKGVTSLHGNPANGTHSVIHIVPY
jgi:hypothetical protein